MQQLDLDDCIWPETPNDDNASISQQRSSGRIRRVSIKESYATTLNLIDESGTEFIAVTDPRGQWLGWVPTR